MARNAKIKIDNNALVHNFKQVKRLAPKAKVVAMVKANAYGHGLVKVAMQLSGLVDYFGVACIDEAICLREAGIKDNILLAEGCYSFEELSLVNQYRFATVIHHEAQLAAIKQFKASAPLDIWLKVNTGMHRLGFIPQHLLAHFNQLKACPSVGNITLMSHMATADNSDSSLIALQKDKFKSALSFLKLPASLANSACIIEHPDSHFDYVRPGIMLYGASPLLGKSAAELNLKPVMHFTSEVIATSYCAKGDFVGYGAIWQAKKDSRIAVVACGYGDGYPRHISDKAYVLIHGKKAPIVGRVSMDMLTVDVTDIDNATVGTPVVLWGDGLSIDTVAQFSDTISYDLLCRMPLRVNYC